MELLTLSVPTDKRTLTRGQTVAPQISAKRVSADGSKQEPLSGKVSLEILTTTDAGLPLVELDTDEVELDAEGTGSFQLLMCPDEISDEECKPGTRVVVRASLKVGDNTLTQSTQVTIGGGGGGGGDGNGDDVCDTSDLSAVDCSLTVCRGKPCSTQSGTGVCGFSGSCSVDTVGDESVLVSVQFYASPTEPQTIMRSPTGGRPVEVRVRVTGRATNKPEAEKAVKVEAVGDIGGVGNSRDVAPSGSSYVTTTAPDGIVRAFFHPGNEVANGALVVTVGDLVVTQPYDVVLPGVIVFEPAPEDGYNRVMGVRGSGWREQNVLRFKLLDSTGLPLVAEGAVEFSAPEVGGAYLAPKRVQLDPQGEVTTTLYSGHGAGTVAVKATVTIGTTVLETTSDTMAIVGAKASGQHFAVSCEKLSVPALVGNDCSFMRTDFQIACTAVMGDRFRNTVGRNVRVNWSTEAALFGPPSFTPEANPDSDPVSQAGLGRTVNTLRTLGARIPYDVEPVAGEPSSAADANDPCQSAGAPARVRNPRDGLVTLVAHTQGEEGFVDANGNGIYDQGEYFFDLGEPYVDANDNNVRDPDEEFVDVNGNGQYDGPNGQWDSNTTIWAVTHVLFTGSPASATWSPDPMPILEGEEMVELSVQWRDGNLNVPAPSYYGWSISKETTSTSKMQQLSSGELPDSYGVLAIHQITDNDEPSKIRSLRTRVSFPGVNSTQVYGLFTAADESVSDYVVSSLDYEGGIAASSGRWITTVVPEEEEEEETP